MSDEDRVPRPPAWPPAAPDAAPGPVSPTPLRVALAGFGLALLAAVALLAGHVEVALYLVVATLYLVAQAADVHPETGRLYAFLGWIPALAGAALLATIAFVTLRGVAMAGAVPRLAVAAFALLGALVGVTLLFRDAADACVRALFRGAPSGHTMRLSATIVVVTLWAGPSLWFFARDVLDEFLADPRRLVNVSSMASSLVGYVALAFAAVGLFVRRDLRAALARLGLTRPRLADATVLVIGTLALWLLNSGLEWFERTALPDLWARDNAFGAALAGALGPGQVALLGLSAGVGEEITLRGALQPKLGIALTSLLFAVLHVQYSWFGILSLLVFGALLGLIRQRTNTTVVIAVHALYDVIAVATARP